MWTTVVLAVLIVLLVHRYLKRRFSVFQSLGINGPPPHVLFGNMYDDKNLAGVDRIRWNIELAEKYGKTFGFYDGSIPVITTSDPDFVLEVLVKQFHNFPGRRPLEFFAHPDAKKGVNMFLAEGPRWKRLRVLANPMFSTAKLKEVAPDVLHCLSRFLENIDQEFQSGNQFDVYDLFQKLTFDIICLTAFGIASNCQDDPNDPVWKSYGPKAHQPGPGISKWLMIALKLFPEFPYWRKVFSFVHLLKSFSKSTIQNAESPRINVNDIVDRMRLEKQSGKNVPKNFLTMMLDAELPEDVDLKKLYSFSLNRDDEEVLKVQRKLTTEEIVSQLQLFLIAGFETTSTTLAFATYLLALNQDAQEKLVQEIEENLEQITYQGVKKLKFLDAVVKETLRLYPLASVVVTRKAVDDCTVQGFQVPANMLVHINTWALHRDPELWGPEPNEFIPERHFNDQRHPMALLPFGGGPRFCAGMRLALMELKIVLTAFVKEYNILPCSKTQGALSTSGLVKPKDGMWISVQKRGQ